MTDALACPDRQLVPAVEARRAYGGKVVPLPSAPAAAAEPATRSLADDLGAFAPAEVQISGDLSALRMRDLLGALAGAQRTALVILRTERCERAVLLAGGAAAWATSTDPRERVHELFCRLDLVDRTARLMRRTGLGDPKDALRSQIGAVLRGAFAESAGRFAVHAVEAAPFDPPAVVHLLLQ